MIDSRRYTLWRQDDNGQRFIVSHFSNRETAEARLQALARLPHKQIYWIEEHAVPGG